MALVLVLYANLQPFSNMIEDADSPASFGRSHLTVAGYEHKMSRSAPRGDSTSILPYIRPDGYVGR